MCLDRKKKAAFIALVAALGLAPLAAREKFALVIGNAAYTTISRLRNPVNDANDMAAALESLGWTVEKVLDGDRARMENAAVRLKARLSGARDSYGLLFYAGHGVQSNGENYLIPVDANIPAESYLRDQTVPLRAILGDLNNAGNALNVIIIDACRDNPFAWSGSRSVASRGLSAVSVQPTDSIVVYATGAGSVASDGTGRNGLFTAHLLRHIKTPGISVDDLFKRTGADVREASAKKQIPAVYSQFFGTAYLGAAGTGPAPAPAPSPAPRPTPGPVSILNGLEWQVDGSLEWEVKGVGVTITKYRGSAATVVIPDRIQGLPVTEIRSRAFSGCTSLTSVTIPSTVTTIDTGAFWGCTGLRSVTISGSVTSIGQQAFRECTALTSVTLPDSVITIGNLAFYQCANLTSVTLSRKTQQVGGDVFPHGTRFTYSD